MPSKYLREMQKTAYETKRLNRRSGGKLRSQKQEIYTLRKKTEPARSRASQRTRGVHMPTKLELRSFFASKAQKHLSRAKESQRILDVHNTRS